MDHHELERWRRSIAMGAPGSPALDREDAARVLARLRDLEALIAELRRRLDELDG